MNPISTIVELVWLDKSFGSIIEKYCFRELMKKFKNEKKKKEVFCGKPVNYIAWLNFIFVSLSFFSILYEVLLSSEPWNGAKRPEENGVKSGNYGNYLKDSWPFGFDVLKGTFSAFMIAETK